jgi:hypothetical protein
VPAEYSVVVLRIAGLGAGAYIASTEWKVTRARTAVPGPRGFRFLPRAAGTVFSRGCPSWNARSFDQEWL